MLITTLLTSSAQLFYKLGVKDLSFNFISIIKNYNILTGLFLYGIGAVLMIIALRGGELSVLYPVVATSYIWVSLLSVWFLGETMFLVKWLGVIAIFSGVVFIGLGSKDKKVLVEASEAL